MTHSLSNMDMVEKGPRSRLLVPLFSLISVFPGFQMVESAISGRVSVKLNIAPLVRSGNAPGASTFVDTHVTVTLVTWLIFLNSLDQAPSLSGLPPRHRHLSGRQRNSRFVLSHKTKNYMT
jgi:hypothetical protein